jgi:hypothetical protein
MRCNATPWRTFGMSSIADEIQRWGMKTTILWDGTFLISPLQGSRLTSGITAGLRLVSYRVIGAVLDKDLYLQPRRHLHFTAYA